MNKLLLTLPILIFFISCSNQFEIVSEFITQQDDSENKIITLYEVDYDPENIDWDQYENFASNLSNSIDTNYEIYFFSELSKTPKLNKHYSIIDSNYHSLCLALFKNDKNDKIFKKYPFKVEVGIHNIVMNDDSTYNISFYAISPFDIGGYQMTLAPTNIITLLSVADNKKSGEHGFMTSSRNGHVLSFSMEGYSIPASKSFNAEDNILCVIKAQCKDLVKLENASIYLDAIFASNGGKKLLTYNIPYKFKD